METNNEYLEFIGAQARHLKAISDMIDKSLGLSNELVKNGIVNFDKVDTETKAAEEKEALDENKWDEHKEKCAGCSACDPADEQERE